jgi:hypothetical protein
VACAAPAQVLQAVDLEDAFIDPEGMLGFTGPGQKPWDLRDRFRKAAVDMNDTFIVRDDWENSWSEVLTGKDPGDRPRKQERLLKRLFAR